MSGILGGEGLAILDVERDAMRNGRSTLDELAHRAQTNGTGLLAEAGVLPMPNDALRLRVRVATVNLTGDYTGFWAKMRLNPRRSVLDGIRSDNLLESCRGYAQLIIDWNITDEDGAALAPTGENVYDLPDDMMAQLVQGYFAHFNAATSVPKP